MLVPDKRHSEGKYAISRRRVDGRPDIGFEKRFLDFYDHNKGKVANLLLSVAGNWYTSALLTSEKIVPVYGWNRITKIIVTNDQH
jgi:hypothetical protein